jgi:predicted phage tail protein
MAEEDPTLPQERPESEPLVDERAGSGCFGLPVMLAGAVIIAALTTATSLIAVIYAAGGVLVLSLAIGLAMTIAKRS